MRRRLTVHHSRKKAHPDNGTDPFNGPDADDIWWGFIDTSEEFDWATAPPGAGKKDG